MDVSQPARLDLEFGEADQRRHERFLFGRFIRQDI
jgi:hypothetical protein